jgi:DNA-binding transcriptional MerR regulator
MTTKDQKTYSIGELAKEFGVTPRAIRFYEDKGLIRPARDGMNRVFSNRERARLKMILQGKRVGLALGDIREIIDLYDLGDGQRRQMQTSLTKFEDHLDDLRKQRDDIEGAIGELERGIKWLKEQLGDGVTPPPAAVKKAKAFERMARRGLGDAGE